MMRIIIVDDHQIVREGLKTILQDDPDFEVVAESGSAKGLAALVRRTRPDVVLLDARLPGVSGAEACRQLVAANPDIAVLMVSSYTDDRLVEECIRAGAKGYLIKDIQRLSLKESIRAVSQGGGAVSPAIAAKVLDRLRTQEDLAPAEPASPLSDTQLDILRLVAAGYSNREIASRIQLSENTIKSHIQEIPETGRRESRPGRPQSQQKRVALSVRQRRQRSGTLGHGISAGRRTTYQR